MDKAFSAGGPGTVSDPAPQPKHAFDSLAALNTFIGQPPRTSRPTAIEQPTINAFGDLTHDLQWIHVDPVRAAQESPLKTTIAHGFLSLSLLTHWHFDCFEYPGARMLLNYGFDKIRFTAPVPSGAALAASFQLLSVASVRDGEARALWNVEARAAGSERPAMVAHWLMQVRF